MPSRKRPIYRSAAEIRKIKAGVAALEEGQRELRQSMQAGFQQTQHSSDILRQEFNDSQKTQRQDFNDLQKAMFAGFQQVNSDLLSMQNVQDLRDPMVARERSVAQGRQLPEEAHPHQ